MHPVPGRRDGLSPFSVLDVTGGEDTEYAGLSRARLRNDIALFVSRLLGIEEGGVGYMTDGEEQAARWELARLSGLEVLDTNASTRCWPSTHYPVR